MALSRYALPTDPPKREKTALHRLITPKRGTWHAERRERPTPQLIERVFRQFETQHEHGLGLSNAAAALLMRYS